LWKHSIVPLDLEEKFKGFLLSSSTCFQISNVPFSSLLFEVLDSLNAEPRITSVVLPLSDQSHWAIAAKFLSSAAYLEVFATYERIDPSFESLLLIGKWDSPRLRGFVIGSPKLFQTHIKIICELCAREGVRELTIGSGLDANALAVLCCNLQENSTLTSLSLNQTDISDVYELMGGLESLSVTNGGVDLSHFFNQTVDSLRSVSLNFSQNRWARPLLRSFRFPPSLRQLAFDEVSFTCQTLCDLLHAIESPISLSIRSLNLSEDDVADVFSGLRLRHRSFALIELHWDQNPVCPAFWDFLQRCPSLEVLTLAGSVVELDRRLTQLIKATSTLATLRLNENRLTKFTNLLKSLRVNRSIRRLNLSGNARTEALLSDLSEVLMANRVIESIELQGDELLSSEVIRRFVWSLQNRGSPLKLDLGQVDGELSQLLWSLAAGDPDVEVPWATVKRQDAVMTLEGGCVLPSVEPIPSIDEREIVKRFDRDFSIQRLIEGIRKSSEA
jgi:hypothetical protein